MRPTIRLSAIMQGREIEKGIDTIKSTAIDVICRQKGVFSNVLDGERWVRLKYRSA
jgi:hypothetical protein